MSTSGLQETVMSCLGFGCDESFDCYNSPEEAKRARMRDKHISRVLKQHQREELKRLKILLLGTGESGKSTITKQMRIIHINGFDMKERMEKIWDIRRNVKESIVVLLLAMQELDISLQNQENEKSREFILNNAGNPDAQRTNDFLEHAEKLWSDEGVQECYSRVHEQGFQLIDSAKYFLDKLVEIQSPAYIPSDQDILRCRCVTTSIQHIEFDVPDGGNMVKFNVYDVGGQQGERKKWIQVFDSVTAILFVADCSSFDQTLREDPEKNRLLEALENFEQVWNNRFLRYVSILLFINKIDVLAEKVLKGRCIEELTAMYPDIFPDFKKFTPTASEKAQFADSFPSIEDEKESGKKKSRNRSRVEVDPEVVKTAVYIKHLFMKIVKGEITFNEKLAKKDRKWHDDHSCEYFYTCAVDTNNIQRVLNGCRTLIIQNHLRRFGII
ncbi:hypothetical protein FSP39_025335 [Pinctada imbricata]|uniref:Guanine nucleotide-binding protein G(s) subunit alpha n=1 Tax=Pinctada imbricata TaxID=66713 RepID=A0AA88YVK8_PINIB|nr:hypothetical protein FSP39_025335 [Pinctada imbricata]